MTSAGREIKHRTHRQGPCGANTAVRLTVHVQQDTWPANRYAELYTSGPRGGHIRVCGGLVGGSIDRYRAHMTSARREFTHRTHQQGPCGAPTAVRSTVQQDTWPAYPRAKPLYIRSAGREGTHRGGGIVDGSTDRCRAHMTSAGREIKHRTHRQGPVGAHAAVRSAVKQDEWPVYTV
jgi:hypothetical protein